MLERLPGGEPVDLVRVEPADDAQIDRRRARGAGVPAGRVASRCGTTSSTGATTGAPGSSLAYGAGTTASAGGHGIAHAPSGSRECRHAELIVGVLEERAAGNPRRRGRANAGGLTIAVADGAEVLDVGRVDRRRRRRRSRVRRPRPRDRRRGPRRPDHRLRRRSHARRLARRSTCGASKRPTSRAPATLWLAKATRSRTDAGACAPVRVGGAIRLSLSPKVSTAAMLRRADDIVQHAARLGLARHVRTGVGLDSKDTGAGSCG